MLALIQLLTTDYWLLTACCLLTYLLATYLLATYLLATYLLATYLLATYLLATYLLATYLLPTKSYSTYCLLPTPTTKYRLRTAAGTHPTTGAARSGR